MYLAQTGIYRARWTDQIHDEWIRNLLVRRPDIPREKLNRVRELMDRYNVQAVHPDRFIADRFDMDAASVIKAARNQRRSLKNPAKSSATILVTKAIGP